MTTPATKLMGKRTLDGSEIVAAWIEHGELMLAVINLDGMLLTHRADYIQFPRPLDVDGGEL